MLLLLENGVDMSSGELPVNGAPDYIANYQGTALHAAAASSHESIVRLLLDTKYEINKSNDDYQAAILKVA